VRLPRPGRTWVTPFEPPAFGVGRARDACSICLTAASGAKGGGAQLANGVHGYIDVGSIDIEMGHEADGAG